MPASPSYPAAPAFFILLAIVFATPQAFRPPAGAEPGGIITSMYNRIPGKYQADLSVPDSAPVPSSLRIVAGTRIGRTAIGEKLVSVLKRFGPESVSDASMGGRSVYTWYGKPIVRGNDTIRYQTDIYFHTPRFGEANAKAVVAKIRVTSPAFRTANGIGVGSGLEAIRRQFPGIGLLASGPDPANGGNLDTYVDDKKGIGFEIKAGICISVTVYERS